MRKINIFLLLTLLALISCRQAGEMPAIPAIEPEQNILFLASSENAALLTNALDEFTEMERSGAFVPGMGLAESKLREEAGDYAGAVLAVFKELSWAYALGAGGISREAIKQGLEKLLEKESQFVPKAREEITEAVRAIFAYFNGHYDDAEKFLGELYGNDWELDSFSRFMLLVCALEKGMAGREERSFYGAIRARYSGFPEYWYHYARSEYAAASTDAAVSADASAAVYAERCINLAPEGPYAAECRIILAKAMGLTPEDAQALRTRLEIEATINEAVNRRNPELLSPLLPLAALPDNPSTLYASGAMRALAGDVIFRTWFNAEAGSARGRLAERLLYISKG